MLAAAGYIWLGWSQSLLLAAFCVVLAHCGSSTNWVFSTTLLQVYTADRFRGRVFAADYGICMLGISASSYLAGVAIDLGSAGANVRHRDGVRDADPGGGVVADAGRGHSGGKRP